MSEREPTVIERMADKFMTVLHDAPRDVGEIEKIRDSIQRPKMAMLAAVRELYEASLDTSGVWTQYGYLKNIIDEHERRAGGKGE